MRQICQWFDDIYFNSDWNIGCEFESHCAIEGPCRERTTANVWCRVWKSTLKNPTKCLLNGRSTINLFFRPPVHLQICLRIYIIRQYKCKIKMNHSYIHATGIAILGLIQWMRKILKSDNFFPPTTSENTVRKNKHMNEHYITVFRQCGRQGKSNMCIPWAWYSIHVTEAHIPHTRTVEHMINCILLQTYSRFTNFAFKPSSRFTYFNAYASRKQTSKFELCKEVSFMDEVYGFCSPVVSFDNNADLKNM